MRSSSPSLSVSQLPSSTNLFDRGMLITHRNRIAKIYPSHAHLKEQIAKDLASRLKHIRRQFLTCVDLGSHTGQLANSLKEILPNSMICTDMSEPMVSQSPSQLKIVADEQTLPFASNSLDLIISALTLHWVNDFPGFLSQVINCLKPDGLFLASIFGQDTLIELRDSLMTAEIEVYGGITPRISPMISVMDAGALLQRAAFALPVVDYDKIQITFPHPLALLHELRYMGETNVLISRQKNNMTRTLLARTYEIYQQRYSLPNGHIYATFDIITLTGWKPHESQPKPLSRGSAKAKLSDYL